MNENVVSCAELERGRGPCDSFGVTYEIKCQTYEEKYVGETARNAFARGKEHLDGMDRDVSQSVLRRHANDCHNGVIPDYVMNVTACRNFFFRSLLVQDFFFPGEPLCTNFFLRQILIFFEQ